MSQGVLYNGMEAWLVLIPCLLCAYYEHVQMSVWLNGAGFSSVPTSLVEKRKQLHSEKKVRESVGV